MICIYTEISNIRNISSKSITMCRYCDADATHIQRGRPVFSIFFGKYIKIYHCEAHKLIAIDDILAELGTLVGSIELTHKYFVDTLYDDLYGVGIRLLSEIVEAGAEDICSTCSSPANKVSIFIANSPLLVKPIINLSKTCEKHCYTSYLDTQYMAIESAVKTLYIHSLAAQLTITKAETR